MSILCAFLYFLIVNAASRVVRNGFPKFPQNMCGFRSVAWNPHREAKVVGGEVPPLGAVPWQIEIRYFDGKHQCGGALISPRLVLTAAHCFDDELRAVAGAYGPPGSSPHEQVLKIEKFIPHPDFRKLGPYSHDLAILLISAPGFKYNDWVKPVCFSYEDPPPGTWCEVSGWGAYDPLKNDVLSSTLKAAAVPVLSLDTCRKSDVYGKADQHILDSMLCAGHLRGGVDSCGGDSGGPLVCEKDGRLELSGIVSWGQGCARKNRPGVYTRVSSFLPWIKEVVMEIGVEYNF